MRSRNIEKKIYEFLGVNIFRKYILFTYDKLWKLLGGAPGYRIKSKTINGIQNYKIQAKAFAAVHFINLIFIIGSYYLFHTLSEFYLILSMIINSYCIITQRYICIRINEILQKHKELEKRREEKHKELERIKEEKQKNEKRILNYNYSSLYQSEKVEEQSKTLSFTDIYYCERYLESLELESLEQESSNYDNGFTKVLKK